MAVPLIAWWLQGVGDWSGDGNFELHIRHWLNFLLLLQAFFDPWPQSYGSSSTEARARFPRATLQQTCLFVMPLFVESHRIVWFPLQGPFPRECTHQGPRLILALSTLPVCRKAVHNPFIPLWREIIDNKFLIGYYRCAWCVCSFLEKSSILLGT